MSKTVPSLATICIAIKEPTFADNIIKFVTGKKGVKEIIECKTHQDLLQFSETPGSKILLLDSGFDGMRSIADIKNITSQINAETTVMFCDDSDKDLLHQLVNLDFKGYLLKTTDCDIIRQALILLLKGKAFIDSAINKLILTFTSDYILYNGIKFTSSEYKMLMLLKDETPPGLIRTKLDITKNTYDEYRGRINKKIHAAGYEDIDDFLSSSA